MLVWASISTVVPGCRMAFSHIRPKNADEMFQKVHGFLRGMDIGNVVSVPPPLKPVENHAPLVVELRQPVPIKHHRILHRPDNLHVGFQGLGGIVLDEVERIGIHEAVLLAVLLYHGDLLPRAKDNHRRSFASLLRLFDQELGAEMEELGNVEFPIGVEKGFPCLVALPVPIVPPDTT